MLVFVLLVSGCGHKVPEMTLEEIESIRNAGNSGILTKTKGKPWQGQVFVPGKTGGIWYSSITGDPKSFNALIGERDAETDGIIQMMSDSLIEYDYVKKAWKPHAASYRVEVNEKAGTLDVYYTLRSDLYWTYFAMNSNVPVTSDDIVFWYNDIYGDEACGSSAYNSQFVTMPDGSEKHIAIEKIDDKTFVFHFPRIDADPLLATNMSIYPSFIYRKAKERGGVKAVKDLFSVAVDPKMIPSCGKWYLTEYTPGQRLVFHRNPYYWDRDKTGISIPYPEQEIVQIVGDTNTQYLLFRQGKLEAYAPRPEELDEVVNRQGKDYTVYNSKGSLGAAFWSFNQNPKNQDQPYYKWFTKKEFRQAMSCLINRDRIISQTYRSLAEPKYTFFPEGNPYYNADIVLQYRYNHSQAEMLLERAGFVKHSDGFLYDSDNNRVEFELTVPSVNTIWNDIAQIITDDCAQEGIKVNVRQMDFQKIVEQLTSTYDWQSVILAFAANMFPSQGSNTWPSTGNLHLWYPLQKKPATDWEARIDYLYNEGCHTIDHDKAKKIWDEYQQILLEQNPIIYLVRGRGFFALRNRWDQTNMYFDNIGGAQTDYLWLSQR